MSGTGLRVGLMGGSFDPVHAAHLRLAHTAMSALSLDQVRWIPVGQAWQKSRQLAPSEHRVAMLKLATQGEPRFVVDTIEVDRPGPSYTLDTVRALQAHDAELFLIIGQDQYTNLPTWHGWQTLLEHVTLAVACRGSQPLVVPEALKTVPHQAEILPMSAMDVSSTSIRERLAKGEPLESLHTVMASDAVAGYIATHQLYASGAPR